MFDTTIYIERRKKLCTLMKSGIILILGNAEASKNYSANVYPFRQDSSFLYFFGIDSPNFVGVIDIDANQHYIFADDVDMHDIIWMGPQKLITTKAAEVGITNSAPLKNLNTFLEQAKQQKRQIHFLPPYRFANMLLLENLLQIPAKQTKAFASLDLIKAIIELRSIKDNLEIAEIENACDISYQMHVKAMQMTSPGIYEREIVGTIEGIAYASGCSLAFATIATKHGETLHNPYHHNILEKGDLLLLDAGCESSLHYASDFTRVIPVGGKFSEQQKEIYNIVLEANNAVLKSAKPDIKWQDMHLLAAKILVTGLKNLGLMRGAIDDIVASGAHALFFPHGLGHMMGLDVHDMEDLGEINVGFDKETKQNTNIGVSALRIGKRLRAGYVLTNEPGIYFIPELIDQWQAINKLIDFIDYNKVNKYRDFGGIRLEDDLLITENGCRLLGKQRIPVTIAEIEAITNKK
jgi:Xaa-Pro aminopeptidase